MYIKFEDFYKIYPIKHFILHEFNGVLISPPFGTELCKDYGDIMIYDNSYMSYIKTNLPPATSKFNSCCNIGSSMYMIPYGIYDEFNCVLEMDTELNTTIHPTNIQGKGQFYSVATNGSTAFSFPLGYSDTSYGLYIENNTIKPIPLPNKGFSKRHMGTVYCNGRYFSMPRSDTPGYTELLAFDGNSVTSYILDIKNPDVTRKYSDILVMGDKLISMPFGETSGINEVVIFDTNTNSVELFELDFPDTAKKFNTFTDYQGKIIAMPYGDEHSTDSDYGVILDLTTKETTLINLPNLTFGGKYRFRSCVKCYGNVYFFNTGSPNCPVLKFDSSFNMSTLYSEYLFGRPIVYNEAIYVIAFCRDTFKHYICKFNEDMSFTKEELSV